jgi:hypothetical protein
MPTALAASRLTAPNDASLAGLLRWACAHPFELLVLRWNWKSALFSAFFRGTIYVTVNWKAGWHAAVGAMLAEMIWRTLTSGGWGAITQQLSRVRPLSQALLGTMLVMPAIGHAIELTIHASRGTPFLARSILVSILFTQIAELFSLYVMRNGAMIVGVGSRSFADDLRRVPGLIVGFVLVIPRAIAASLRNRGVRSAP